MEFCNKVRTIMKGRQIKKKESVMKDLRMFEKEHIKDKFV